MAFTAAISRHPLPTHAAGEVVGSILEEIGPEPDLVLLLVTGPFAGALPDMARTVSSILSPTTFLGTTTAEALTGDPTNGDSSIVLFAASWDGRLRTGIRGLRTLTFTADRTDGLWHVRGDEDLVGATGTLVLFTTREGFPTEEFVDELGRRNPELRIVGGVASSPSPAGPEGLIVDGAVVDRGAVGLLLPEEAPVRTVISPGARPVGDPYVVTAARDGFVDELAGRPALERVLDVADGASPEDRRALSRGVNLGIFLTERPDGPRPGDVLVRRVPGADHRTGAIAVDGPVAVGTTVQVRARDPLAAEQDLRTTLSGEAASGALVFGDLGWSGGRDGTGRSVGPIVLDHVGRRGVAAVGCSTVIGPVADRPWLHEDGLVILLLDD